MLRRFLAGLSVILSVASAAEAGPLEDGLAAYDRGDYETALWLLQPLAEQGDAGAQLYLAEMYLYGRGLPQSDAEFLKWHGQALAQWPEADRW